MHLFVGIAIICLLLTLGSEVVKLLHISTLFSCMRKRSSDAPELEEQLEEAKAELDRLRKNNTASGEYARFVKEMRAEQNVKNVEEKIRSERNMGRLKLASVDLIAGYAFKALLSFVLVVISIRNRYTPVFVFDERFNFQPLEGLLSFPTGVHNAVSVPVWVLSCNVSFRLISSLVKGKK